MSESPCRDGVMVWARWPSTEPSPRSRLRSVLPPAIGHEDRADHRTTSGPHHVHPAVHQPQGRRGQDDQRRRRRRIPGRRRAPGPADRRRPPVYVGRVAARREPPAPLRAEEVHPPRPAGGDARRRVHGRPDPALRRAQGVRHRRRPGAALGHPVLDPHRRLLNEHGQGPPRLQVHRRVQRHLPAAAAVAQEVAEVEVRFHRRGSPRASPSRSRFS